MFKQARVYSCGHRTEFTVNEKPEQEEIQVFLPCPNCRKAENNKILTAAELNNSKPALRGTPAQIEYGDMNRQRFINEWVKRASDTQAEIIRNIIKNEDHGGFWMDNKDKIKSEDFINNYVPSKKMKATVTKFKKNKSTNEWEKEARDKADANRLKDDILKHIIKPANPTSNILVYIELKDKTTVNAFPTQYNDEIKTILQNKGYSYFEARDCYTREITEYTGNYIDRAAELGIEFINKGYAVSILSTKVMGMIENKTFKPEITRWIKRFNPTHVYLDWVGYERVLCNRALNFIQGAYWEQNYKKVIAPITSYKDIQKYAEKNGFAIDSKSRDMLERARRDEM